MNKVKDIRNVETNPYWRGCHIVDGRDDIQRNPKIENLGEDMFYHPMSIQHLDAVFADDSEEDNQIIIVTDNQTPKHRKYDNFPDISTDNNTLTVLNRSADVICVTLSLVGSKSPVYYHQRKSKGSTKSSTSSRSHNGSKHIKCFLGSTISYHDESPVEGVTVDDKMKQSELLSNINTTKRNEQDRAIPVVCFVVVMSPWTIIELGLLTKKSQFEIFSDIKKLIPTYDLLSDNIQSSQGFCLSYEHGVEKHSDNTNFREEIVKQGKEDNKYNFLGLDTESEESLNFDIFPLS
jgi:hypothetical protein